MQVAAEVAATAQNEREMVSTAVAVAPVPHLTTHIIHIL